MNNRAKITAFLSLLIAAWESADNSHKLGTDVHLRLRDFVQQLPDDTEPENLKTLIAPILTHDKEQQNIFYEIFDKSLKDFSENFPKEIFSEIFSKNIFEKKNENNFEKNISEKKIPEKNFFQKYFWWIISLILIPVAFFIGKDIRERYFSKIKPPLPKTENPIFVSETVFVNMLNPKEQSLCFDSMEKKIFVKEIERKDEKKFVHSKLRIPNRKAKDGNICLFYTPISKGYDTTTFKFKLKNDSIYERMYIFQTDTFYINEFAKQNPDIIAYKPFRHNPDISSLEPKETWHFGWAYAKMHDWKWLTLLIFTGLIFGVTYWYRRSKEKLILNHVPNDKAPYIWSLKFPNVQGLSFNENIYKTISELLQRSDSEVQRIDMWRTIKATIQNVGHITLQYRAQTRPNEYLLLIDTHSPQNHRAQLFNLLYHAFDASEVLIERFYFDGDLRLFWNEKMRRGISLNALQTAYPEHRLVILGDAVSLLSPTNGKFLRWANIFDSWRKRALLTPRPVYDWDAREAQLAQKFRVLPATLQGIGDLVENLEAVEPKDYRLWKNFRDKNADTLPISADLPNDALLVLLEAAFVTYDKGKRDDRLLQWISACAVSPILYFDWTLHVASVIDISRSGILTLENLFQINRLPWFVDGKMPDTVRIALLDWLEKNHPETLIAVRKEWQKILENEKNTPPADSTAFEEHRIQILFNEWQLNKKLPPNKFDEIEKLLRHNNEALVVEFLRRAPTALDTIVPPRFRKFVRDSNSFIPKTKKWLLDLGWQIPILFLLGIALWLFQPKGLDCTGKTVVYHGKKLCIKNLQDELVLYEYILCDTMRDLKRLNDNLTGSPQEIDSLLKARNLPPTVLAQTDYEASIITGLTYIMRTEHLDSSSFYKNIPIAYYNAATYFYNKQQRDSACIFYNKLNNWAWRDSVVTTDELQKLAKFCSNSPHPDTQNIIKDPFEGQMVFVQGGNFTTGSEKKAALLENYFIGKFEVTQKQWKGVMGEKNNPSRFIGDDFPVENVSWDDIQIFLQKLNTKTHKNYSLPTETEWEFAARGGNKSNNYQYSGSNNIDLVAWHSSNAGTTTHSVGQKQANELGIFDMTGNIWEWCNDAYSNTDKVIKGGSWNTLAASCTISSRYHYNPSIRYNVLGFRVVISPKVTPQKNNPSKQNIQSNLPPTPQNDPSAAQQKIELEQLKQEVAAMQNKGQQQQQIDQLNDEIGQLQNLTNQEAKNNQTNSRKDQIKLRIEKLKQDVQQLKQKIGQPKVLNNQNSKPNFPTTTNNNNQQPTNYTDPFDGQMVFVQGGTFQLGCTEKDVSICLDNEKPAHAVTLSSYSIGKYEVTQKQWKAVMGEKNNPSYFKSDDLPVETVSWYDVQEFLQKLNTQTGKKFRLPTEAEWEFAARGGKKSNLFSYSGSDDLNSVAWYSDNSEKKTHPVGQKKANELGLYDMSGNVWEWCNDLFGDYETNVGPNPQGAGKGSSRVVRGGSWFSYAQDSRISVRDKDAPVDRVSRIGFRVASSELSSAK